MSQALEKNSSSQSQRQRIWVHQELIASAAPQKEKQAQRQKSISVGGLAAREKTEWDWKEAFLVHRDDDELVVELVGEEGTETALSPEKITVPSSALTATGQVLLANDYPFISDTALAICPHDLINLTHLHEPSVVECLQQRFFQNIIYTRTGPIMIALNPFQSVPHLYSSKLMAQYWDRAECQNENQDLSNEELPPHIFEIADHAFRQMQRGLDAQIDVAQPVGCEQAILVSGESGAGKTVTTKYVMKYLATLSERIAAQRSSVAGRKKVLRVRKGTTPSASVNPSGRFSHSKKKVAASSVWSIASASKNTPVSPGFGLKKTPVSPGIGLLCKSPGGILKAHISPGFGLKKMSVSPGIGLTKTPVTPGGIMKQLPFSSDNELKMIPSLSPTKTSPTKSIVRAKSGELDAIQNVSDSNNGIEAQVLQCNPILESFGNARTVRNDNSSRFGKFIEIQFTRLGKLVGAQIETYLLEKVRVVQQNPGERNYHVFYELLLGETDDEELALYHLHRNSKPTDFRITTSGTYDRRDKVSDADTYQDVRRAMDTMHFSLDEQCRIFGLVAAILHGSNLDFDEVDEAASLKREHTSLDAFCNIMGVSVENLEQALCTAKVVISNNTFERRLTAVNAEKGLDALLKATYGALFDNLVKRINDSIACRSTNDPFLCPVATIGVLDIFGFESFVTNTFEQLCINFCNETLQQQFNSFVLENEQAEYEREGINWSFIEFPGNLDVIELIEKRAQGILSILDDHCRVPNPKDTAYALDVYKICGDHHRFSATKKQTYSLQFSVMHYAGLVEYTMEGFTEKNCDDLPKETTELLKNSENPFVQQLAKIIETCHALPPVVSGSNPSRQGSRAESSGQRSTVGEQFRRQLKNLRVKIDKTAPHYIRCLKPNAQLQSGIFDTCIISEQLKCGGILEAVRVSRAGFAQHYPHAKFIGRYGALLGVRSKPQATQEEARTDCEKLVRRISQEILLVDGENKETSVEKLIQLGKTKVFLAKFAFETLERTHGKRQELAATKLNSIFRRYMARVAFPALLEAHRAELAEAERLKILEQEARERRQAAEREGILRKGLNPSERTDEEDSQLPADFEYDKLRHFAEEVAKRKKEAAPEAAGGELKWVVENGQWVRRAVQPDPVKEDEQESPVEEEQDEKMVELVASN